MHDTPLGTVGEIVRGSDEVRFVEVVDDSVSTGGYLILMYANADRSGVGFDAWVESAADIEPFFQQAGWTIRWPTDGPD